MGIKQGLLNMYNLDFSESSSCQVLSIEDERFVKLMNSEDSQQDGKYFLPLPIRSPNKEVPSNRFQVPQRPSWLKQKLLNND